MQYTVVWKRLAERQLAEIWADSSKRKAVAEAANAIELVLRTRPAAEGESRHEDIRVLVIEPLAVHYGTSEPDRLVQVLTNHARLKKLSSVRWSQARYQGSRMARCIGD